MGKIIYEPKKKLSKKETSLSISATKKNETVKPTGVDFVEQRYNALIESIDSVRPIGDTDCDYVVYLEDYVYTYIYQYAGTNLECEHSAIILGGFYPDTKEFIVCGILPISKEYLTKENEWVNEEAINNALEEKEKYFKGTSILGWMHMQPGYGTMLTMKEVKVHRDIFDKQGTLLLLLDPINKIENFYIYEDDTLKEQSGYYIYYDKNACMQHYMLDHPFVAQEKEQVEDTVVNQFREIGRKRKKEYEQRKRLNFTVAASALTLLAMAAVMTKMSDQRSEIKGLQNNLAKVNTQVNTKLDTTDETDGVEFTIAPNTDITKIDNEQNKQQEQDSAVPEEVIDANSNAITIIDKKEEEVEKTSKEAADTLELEAQKEKVAENVVEPVKKEEVKENNKVENNKVENNKVEIDKVEIDKEDTKDYLDYVVQEGDTLLKISYEHYQTESKAKEIIKLNNINNGDHIYIGQKIKIPAE